MRTQGLSEDHMKLKAFLFSLHENKGLTVLFSILFHYWLGGLKSLFLEKYFQPQKATPLHMKFFFIFLWTGCLYHI